MKEIIVLQNGNPVSVFVIQERLDAIRTIEGQIRSAQSKLLIFFDLIKEKSQ